MANVIRTILITGSTDGIGKQTALELAKNAENHVIVHGRDETRCKNAVSAIRSATGIPSNQIDYIVADFANMKAVKDMATEVERRFPKLNVLVCNAGVLARDRQLTADGLELTFQVRLPLSYRAGTDYFGASRMLFDVAMAVNELSQLSPSTKLCHFQVNHLAHFLLATKLCNLLKRNRPSRVIVVSSICHSWHPIDWNDLMAEKDYEKYLQYSRSKLMNHLFTFALARRFASDPEIEKGSMTANVLEPGVVETKLLRAGGYSGAPVEQGAVTSVYLAQSKDVEGVSGLYFNNSKRKTEPWAPSKDEEAQEKLWKMSEDLCQKLGVW